MAVSVETTGQPSRVTRSRDRQTPGMPSLRRSTTNSSRHSSRALLALYCFKRVHLKSIALALAETCSKDDLIVHGGDYGADLYERARRAPQVVEQRPKISLSRGALMKVVVDQDLI